MSIKATMAVILGATAMSANAQVPLPYNFDFESFNLTQPMNAQGWSGGGAWFVRDNTTDPVFAGTKVLKFRQDVAFPLTGTGFNAFQRYALDSGANVVNSGTIIAQGWAHFVNDPEGESAFSLEFFANYPTVAGTAGNRVVSVGFNQRGETYLRRRSDAPADNATLPTPALQTTPPGTWNHIMVVFDITNNIGYGFVNFQPLTDASGNLLSITTELTTRNMVDVTFGAYIGNGANRRAFGVSTPTPRGRDFVLWDNVRVDRYSPVDPLTNLANIRGKVNLPGYGPGTPGQTVTVTVTGATTETMTSTVDSNGEFNVQTTQRGVLSVRVKMPRSLSRTVSNVTLAEAGVYYLNFNLPNGNVNGDGEVGPADFSEVLAGFGAEPGSPGYDENPTRDLDGNNEVGPGDFSLVLASFGLEDE